LGEIYYQEEDFGAGSIIMFSGMSGCRYKDRSCNIYFWKRLILE
jgi:hypothetical protein